MSRGSFPTSPAASGEQRKFMNPTPGYVGANIFGPDGKPTAIAVEPGGEVWLTAEEERMTAEAPRMPSDNPFIKQWDEVVEYDSFNEPIRHVTRSGVLVLTDEPARPVASSRFVPAERDAAEAASAAPDASDMTVEELEAALEAKRGESGPQEPAEETVKGADVPEPSEPAPQGQPSPDEIVGTPEAVAANDEAVAKRKPTREQPTSKAIPT